MRTPQEAHILATTQHLENLVKVSVDAVNARNFDPNSLAWNFCAPDFEARSPNLVFIWGTECAIQSKEAHLTVMRELVEQNPDFQVKLQEMDALLDRQQEHGMICVKLEMEGLVPGVTMKEVIMLHFIKSKSQASWLCTQSDGVRSVD